MEANLCGACRRPTTSKHGYCYRAGKCNAARQAAIREAKRQGDSQLMALATEAIEGLIALNG